ncbi:MAG: DUF4176 domain-containing protein [Lachnospiraceae bacterium]
MKQYLPIGSVVLLKEGTKKIMIYGRKQIAVDSGEEYDYIACFYPEENINDQYMFLFNNEDIEATIFEGFKDDEEVEFVKIMGQAPIL